jgi:hypothetical protein
MAVLGLALLPVVAGADEVFIRGGGQLSGDVVERGPDFIMVDIGTGRIGLPLSSVERIVPGDTPVRLYRQRAASLDTADVEGWLALGRWARGQELEAQAREAFARVVAVDPAHAAARRALGHVQLGGEWMTREESLRARGYVPFEGDWVTPDARREVLDQRRAAAEQRRAEAEATVRVREAEARARAAEADARRAEVELRRVEADAVEPPGFDGGGWTPWYAGTYPAFTAGLYPVRPHFHSGLRSRCGGLGTFQPFPTMLGSHRARVPSRAVSGRPRGVLRPPPHRLHFPKRGK